MRYILYDSKGEMCETGVFPTAETLDSPGAEGTIALELPDGRWLRIGTSEYAWVEITDSPEPKKPEYKQ